jgi:hypothetical protein
MEKDFAVTIPYSRISRQFLFAKIFAYTVDEKLKTNILKKSLLLIKYLSRGLNDKTNVIKLLHNIE